MLVRSSSTATDSSKNILAKSKYLAKIVSEQQNNRSIHNKNITIKFQCRYREMPGQDSTILV